MDHATTTCSSAIEAYQWLKSQPEKVEAIVQGDVSVYPPFADPAEVQQNKIMKEVAKRFKDIDTSPCPYLTLTNILSDVIYKELMGLVPLSLTFPLVVLGGVQINFEGEDGSDFFVPNVCTAFIGNVKKNLLPSISGELEVDPTPGPNPDPKPKPIISPIVKPGLPPQVIKAETSRTDEKATGVEGESTWDEITEEFLSDGSQRTTTITRKKLVQRNQLEDGSVEITTTLRSTTRRLTRFPPIFKHESAPLPLASPYQLQPEPIALPIASQEAAVDSGRGKEVKAGEALSDDV
eukprot:TRINITY_DN7719_c0_g1_i11.p1 TRINITY_DN7719_c0_g1~~TRINITY_DN7719_c0_g1_i11.p1  ORF type:complete len:337 (-),score=115.80 TRINITY_DN7719_c0_g1_i11:106-984(-)